jgi:uncharacterized protein YdaU (DUF1376 family)
MRPLPYYKWHWQDWRANRTVQRMTYIERGLYRELLDECWSEGGIPTDMQSLSDICGCPVDVMANAWQVLSKCFTEKHGVFVNGRLEKERTEKDAQRIILANNGRQGGCAKSLKEKETEANAKQMLSKCHIGEERREEESRGEKTLLSSGEDEKALSGEKINYQGIVDLYNRILPDLPKVKTITPKRRTAMKSCCHVKPAFSGMDFWEAFFEAVKKSDFLMGRSKDWKADFDFLTTHSKFVKVYEGAYR